MLKVRGKKVTTSRPIGEDEIQYRDCENRLFRLDGDFEMDEWIPERRRWRRFDGDRAKVLCFGMILTEADAREMQAEPPLPVHDLFEPPRRVHDEQGPPESSATADTWPAFEARLTDVLTGLPPGAFLLLYASPRGTRVVQFAAQGDDGMRVEVVSNQYLSKGQQIPAAGEARLAALGWRAPTISREQENRDEHEWDGSPNWFRDFASPVPFKEIAALAVATLLEVLDARQPSRLRYTLEVPSEWGDASALGVERHPPRVVSVTGVQRWWPRQPDWATWERAMNAERLCRRRGSRSSK